jgi:APA family basic amino acid/polyamine antiporter
MIISMISGINAYHLMASRIPYAMATDGLLTQRAARVNQGGTPTTALLLSVIVSVAFIVGSKQFERVIETMAFFFVVDYAMAYVAVFVLRRREPGTERPYRAWGYPWTTGAALIGSVAFLVGAVWSDTWNSLYALGVLAAGYPLYKLFGVVKKTAPL